MPAPNEFPSVQAVFEGFAPFSPSMEGGRGPWLQNLSCTVLVVKSFDCFSAWRMKPRKLPNDLFFHVMKGCGEARVSGRAYRLEEGLCLHLRRGEIHEVRHDPASPLRVLVLHYSACLDFSLPVSEVFGFPDLFDLRGDPFALHLLWECCRLNTLMPPGWQAAMNANALAFLYRLLHEHGAACRALQARRLSDLARLSPVTRLMQESLSEGLSVDDYARKASMSAVHFRRVFRKTIGLSPNGYLRQLRLQRAALLLRNTGDTLEAIAFQVGYAEVAFFAKTFKAEMGISPGAYRKRADLMEP